LKILKILAFSNFQILKYIRNKQKGMSSFEVIGGNKLRGEIIPQGAKNEALQILSAVLLTAEPVTISNIPDILDVNLLIELLQDIGVKITRSSRDTCTFQADEIDADYLASEEFRKKGGRLRGSVMFAGPDACKI
jgi:UDP-N-acetylglucosamine 1-carboxyvinyltransferase